MKKILITGGAGFIGTHLARVLTSKGYTITILDNLSEQIHGNSPQYKLLEGVSFIKGDVCNTGDVEKAINGQEVIVHLAAETGTGQSMYEVNKYVDVNIGGTARILDHLVNKDHQVKKFIVASSRAIYGEGKYYCQNHQAVYPSERKAKNLERGNFEPKCPVCNNDLQMLPTDEQSKIHPSSVYGITKQNQEQMVLNVCRSINIPAIAFRYQNVYGPGQSLKNPYTGILSIFSTQIRNGNDINIFEDGNESRDFVFIEDVVNATIKGIEADGIQWEAFNVGSGQPTTVLQVAETLRSLYNSDINIHITGNFRLGDIRHNVADLTKVKQLLKFVPTYDFKSGAEKFVRWVLTQEVNEDRYERSISEMKEKGLFK